MRSVLLAALLFGSVLVHAQTSPPVPAHQEDRDAEHQQTHPPANKQTLAEVMARLKRSLNGKAMVRNQCLFQGKDFEVDESTEIAEISGCKVIFKTRKTTISPEGRREVEFTLDADLADLTTPPSVDPQSFSQCKPIEGAVLKVMSRAQPGKAVRTTRQSTSGSTSGTSKTGEAEAQPPRRDISLFFPDPVTAKRAARALDQALKLCGGKEWPDEDDLP
jgi:hypothetical protein